jgi:hypothetical protein
MDKESYEKLDWKEVKSSSGLRKKTKKGQNESATTKCQEN